MKTLCLCLISILFAGCQSAPLTNSATLSRMALSTKAQLRRDAKDTQRAIADISFSPSK